MKNINYRNNLLKSNFLTIDCFLKQYLRKCLIEKRIIVLLIDIYDPLQRAHDSYEFLSKYFVLNWFYGVHLKARVFVI